MALVIIISSVVYVQAYHSKNQYMRFQPIKKSGPTFDISWGNKTPMPVIEILKENNLRLPFSFRSLVKEYPDIVRTIF
jgi:hypothetical protein